MKKTNPKTRRSNRILKAKLKKTASQHTFQTVVLTQEALIKSDTFTYDNESLLERCHTQWQLGDWLGLMHLQRENIESHTERARLALLAAAGHLQLGDMTTAWEFVKLAQEWECDKLSISRVLIAGVYNTLGKSAIIAGEEDKALNLFEKSVKAGVPNSNTYIQIQLAKIKAKRDFSQLEQIKYKQNLCSLPLDNQDNNIQRISEQHNINNKQRLSVSPLSISEQTEQRAHLCKKFHTSISPLHCLGDPENEKITHNLIDNSNGGENIFSRVICLTIPEQRNRQLNAVKEFQKVGINNYEFHAGYTCDSQQVVDAFAEKRVKTYPNCFRCGRRDCGKDNCNNVLLPEQVAVALSFQSIFERICKCDDTFVAVCEDDVVFSNYASSVLISDKFKDLLFDSDIKTDEALLIQLSTSTVNEQFFLSECSERLYFTKDEKITNAFFVVNKAFAELAYQRLKNINHTAAVIIHELIPESAGVRYLVLNIPLATDGSIGLANIPSLVLPTLGYVEYLKKNKEPSVIASEEKKIFNHRRKIISRKFAIVGSPRCGSHFVSAFLKKNDLDIEHEKIGRDGICAWQYTVDSKHMPYISDIKSNSSFFLHIDEWLMYTRNPLNAIPSLVIENQYAPLSYAFRRDHIKNILGINLDTFSNPIEKAVRSYVHWYQIAMDRKPVAILHVENFLADCQAYFTDYQLHDVEISKEESSAKKLYLGHYHKPQKLEKSWKESISEESFSILLDIADQLGYEILV